MACTAKLHRRCICFLQLYIYLYYLYYCSSCRQILVKTFVYKVHYSLFYVPGPTQISVQNFTAVNCAVVEFIACTRYDASRLFSR